MKNKLLVTAFAMVGAVLAFTSCEKKPDIMAVNTNLVKASMHKSARSLLQQTDQKLKISEYEFLGGVNDNRLVFRTISFGNGSFEAKHVDSLTYEYGDWNDQKSEFSLLVTPRTGDPFTLIYKGNAFLTPDGLSIGGEGTDNTARVEKWEKTMTSFPNNEWEATFRGEFVTDSVMRDSIDTIYIPKPYPHFRYDTLQVFDHMDTLSADTTCYFRMNFNRDASTLANTGHLYKKSVRAKYNKETRTDSIVGTVITEYDFVWYFSEVLSDARFTIVTKNTTNTGAKDESLVISKFATDSEGKAASFQLGGLIYQHPAVP